MPYTYLIGWKEKNLWYYGVRYSKDCDTNDLWESYYTSSKYVQKAREKYGEPDVIQVRKTFGDAKRAIKWEKDVLRRMNVLNKDNWLNKNISGRHYIKKQDEEHIRKRTQNKNHHPNQRYFALEASKIAAEKRKGKKDSEETKRKRKESWRKTVEKNGGIKIPKRSRYLIEGKIYLGLKTVAEEFGVSQQTVCSRLKSEKFPNWSKI